MIVELHSGRGRAVGDHSSSLQRSLCPHRQGQRFRILRRGETIFIFFRVFETVGDAVSCVGEVANIRSGAKVVSDIAAQPVHTGELHGNLLRASSRPAEPEQQGQLEGEGAPAARPLRGGPEQAGGEQLPGHPRLDGGGEQVKDGGGDQHERELE